MSAHDEAALLGGENEPKKSKKPAAAESANDNITMSASALEAMFSKFAETIANAMIESKKPYIDPRKTENDDNMRETTRKLQERIQADIKASQANCPHYQGSNPLSEFQGALTSIAKHRLDDGKIIGICTNCLRIFKPGDPDYITQLQRKSGNRMSQAGQRFMLQSA